jgi:hypothetical protein
MRPGSLLVGLTIRVPGPFAGVTDLGFSARYPDQPLLQRLRDVAIWVEGPATPMRRLVPRLELLAESPRPTYRWQGPVALTDEVLVLSFRDQSQDPSGEGIEPASAAFVDYLMNLVRPVVFPFLQDCVQVAHLRLSERIDLQMRRDDELLAVLPIRVGAIVSGNGDELLVA